MTLSPRAKLLLLASFFVAPVVASFIAYRYVKPAPTANYGELVPSAMAPSTLLVGTAGEPFIFGQLAGKWILVANDTGACPPACVEKLVTMRQVRLAVGRNASRVERVFVVDDGRLAPDLAGAFPGMVAATRPAGQGMPAGAGNDRDHVYLIDPHGNVVMRWPARADGPRVIRDLDRLLRASQIG
jgi:hypothetical protein